MRRISELIDKYGMFSVSYCGTGSHEYIPAYTRGVMDTNIIWDFQEVPRYRVIMSAELVKYKIKVAGISTSPGETIKIIFENPTGDELRVPYGKRLLTLALV